MLKQLRKPEYTGENRCWPCTALNTVLLLLACTIITVVPKKFAPLVPSSRARRLGVASALGFIGGAAITLRGYFIPGTPHIAPRLPRLSGSHPENRNANRQKPDHWPAITMYPATAQ
ncbi:hypothetical protein ACFFQF_13625 [Haladaptatus pallidirubidus]|uniref:hypothetical protein n=1 Tax=Haladaptatus pallidirubidus TaxID=1008152 RepID=UPI0035E933F6